MLLLELEHWRGPRFNDEIASIPSGVAEHKADDRTRHYEGVDRTQVWWKDAESRYINGEEHLYRTLEVEELVEDTAAGLAENSFGCRYAHAEYSERRACISHFDGAIRAYQGDEYLSRIECAIDRAGKHAKYTKLFRLDGSLSISVWKRLLTDFFRGNTLIPEYLGADEATFHEIDLDGRGNEEQARQPEVAAFVSLKPGRLRHPMQLLVEGLQQIGSLEVPYVEIGTGEIAEYSRQRFDLSDTCAVGFRDPILNLSRIAFSSNFVRTDDFAKAIDALATALENDAKEGHLRLVAIPIAWEWNEVIVSLTVAGDAPKVAHVLSQLPDLLKPTCSPSAWIEALAHTIELTAESGNLQVLWNGVSEGRLTIPRVGEVEVEIQVPQQVRRQLEQDQVI